MRKLWSWIIIVVVPVMAFTFSFIEYSENLKLKHRLGESYYNTINYFQAEVITLRSYLDDREHVSEELLVTLYNHLLEVAQGIDYDSQRLPMRKNYYAELYRSLSSDVEALTDAMYRDNGWIDKAFVLKRIYTTCNKLQWSFDVIVANAEKRGGKYGYFEELYYRNSKTHSILDKELERYLFEELRIDI